jgi:aldehyde dehydrogenase (NAD+)
MDTRNHLYIDGQWVPSSATGTLEVLNSATEEVIARVPAGTVEDVDRAVDAAVRAFPGWAARSVEQRAAVLAAIADGLRARAGAIAEVTAQEVGMPVGLAKRVQAGLPIITFASMPQLLQEIVHEERIGNSLVIQEPIGVVACITPWNFPLHQIAAKVAPALAAGCTVVVKPSELAPLSAYILAEVMDEVGVPAGAFNLLMGTGPVVGEHLARHPGVDMITFTGSIRSGRRVSELASATVKPVTLELGGKSANVLLDDADFERAVRDGVAKCFLNSGQACNALTRMLVPRSRLAEVERLATDAAEAFTLGDPFHEGTRLGPLVSAAQRERVRDYIDAGIAEGARVLTGGSQPPEGFERGFFVWPTVFTDVRADMTIAREEIFGPVLAILPYDDDEDAVAIANDTVYGLAAAVWSADPERAQRVARQLRAGQVEVNGGAFNPLAPFGGFKQSGHGRELGRYAIEEFLTTKSLQLESGA